MRLNLRPSQQEILKYKSGWMGISAVPGSGKTFTLSALAANIIHQGWLEEDQEVLVVTLVNSAVDNFSRRVSSFLKDERLLPGMSYRVRTLHGLAHDIIRERPGMVGLTNDFSIIDDHDAQQILTGSINTWIQSHADEIEELIDETALTGYGLTSISKKFLPGALQEAGNAFIRTAKDRQLSPEDLPNRLKESDSAHPLVEMGCQIYADYQRALIFRNSLDFDDLIRHALFMLQNDDSLVQLLRRRWPYILEDEAQDSSRLQEDILRLLAGTDGNWVRVGDPNQAIYETFTTANPQYLRDFIRNPQVQAHDLPASGRSSRGIIDLSNYLIDWVRLQYPYPPAREALAPPYIQPVEADDPAPNPANELTVLHAIDKVYNSEDELSAVALSAGRWVQAHPDATLAVLAQQNKHMEALSEILKRKGIPYMELLRSTSSSRETVARLTAVVRSLVNPRMVGLLADAYKGWTLERTHLEVMNEHQTKTFDQIRHCDHPEQLFYPLDQDPLDAWEAVGIPVEVLNQAAEFRAQMLHWFAAAVLPIDQLLLTIAGDLFSDAANLALVHKIASYLANLGRLHPDWRLPEYAAELATFAGYQRKLIGFSEEDAGFDPEKYRGKVVLATLHKAKGLEWDKVYLTSVNNFDFPSGAAGDEFYSERWFLRGQMNLVAETLAELDHLLNPTAGRLAPRGEASRKERTRLIQERLRLLFVGVTRAKYELTLTCNNGSRQKAQPSVALIALKQYLDELEVRAHG
jgi:DNA helicase II / ATP-dependent DNA helicase PcrA